MGQSTSTETQHRITWHLYSGPIKAQQLIITTHTLSLWRMQKRVYKGTRRSSMVFSFSLTHSYWFKTITFLSFYPSILQTHKSLTFNITSQSSSTVISNQPAKMVHPTTTCCKTSQDGSCVCAAQAKCSCGQQSALHCSCNKASSENTVSGPRCSCRMWLHYSDDLEETHILTYLK